MPNGSGSDRRLDLLRQWYLKLYREAEKKIRLKAGYLILEINRRRYAGRPILALEAGDLVTYGWEILLQRLPILMDAGDMFEFFSRRMENYVKETGRRRSEASLMGSSLDDEVKGFEVDSVISLSAYRNGVSVIAAREQIQIIRDALRDKHPELLPLFELMATQSIFRAAEQAAHLKLDVNLVYRLRDRLRKIIRELQEEQEREEQSK